MSFSYRGLKCKSRKSRDTCNNRQVWPWNTEWNRAKAIEFCQENALIIANTLFQQHKRQLCTWTSADGQYQIRLIIFFAAKDGEALYSQQKQDRELTVAQIMNPLLPNSDLHWRKVGKTTRPFRYDLNYIPYDYTVEVTNRLKGLDLIECLMNYGWRFVTLCRRQGSRPSPWKRNAEKRNGYLRRP